MGTINGNYRQYKLDNGLTVALQNTPTETFTARLRVNQGAYHEREGEEGLAHLLEHCLATGGSCKYSPEDTDEIMEPWGWNVVTGIGRTILLCSALAEDLGLWLDLTSDQVFRPRFDLDRMWGERQRILREIADCKSHPTHLIDEELRKAVYRGHPKGRFILGKEEVVRSKRLKDIQEFYSRGFCPINMTLMIAGGLPKDIDDLVRRYFSDFRPGKDTTIKFPKLDLLRERKIIHKPAPEAVNHEYPGESSAKIQINYVGPANEEPNEYAVRIMNKILGTRLYQSLGRVSGLAYNTSTGYDGTYNAGELNISASVPASRVDNSIKAIFDQTKKMRKECVGKETVERAKKLVRLELAKSFETNEGHVQAIETLLDYGVTSKGIRAGFNKVTPEMIRDAANKYLPDNDSNNYVLTILDPLKQ